MTPTASNPPHDPTAILRDIRRVYRLPLDGIHGLLHWARVCDNATRLARAHAADEEVARLFALFHDSQRVNECTDPDHGRRGGDLARSWRGRLVHLDDARFQQLYEACLHHTEGLTTSDPTIQACWDADRLDLGRVGIRPTPHRLGSEAARELLAWSHARAVGNEPAVEILNSWEWGPEDSLIPGARVRRSG